MRYLKRLIFSIIILISCSTNTDPIDTISSDYDVYIRPTGDAELDYQEFSFINISNDTLYYVGLFKTLPLYTAQMQSDTGWVQYNFWRCGNGVKLIKFEPSEIVKTNVYLPPENLPWRVGLSVRKEPDGERYYCWSAVQN